MANMRIHNKRAQKVTIAVLDAAGTLVRRDLQPYEQTEPIDEARIGEYTRRLAEQQVVRLRPVS